MAASRARRASTVVAVAAVAVGVAGTLAAHGQSELTAFEATASAEGVRIGVAAPNFAVVDQLADVGAPVAQSAVDGLGNSKAFASNPYPGELVITGPGLLAGLTGLPNPGNYPLYVATSYPTAPAAKISQPGYELSAKSADASSEALASSGGLPADTSIAAARATAISHRSATSATVSAEAASAADAVSLSGGALRIGAVRATAKVSRRPGSPITRSSSLSIDGVSISGQAVGISDKGLVVAGTTTPIADHDPLAQALEQANISVRYVKAVSDPDGVVSPGLVVSQRQQVPQGPTLFLTYVFGRAVAHASLASATAAPVGVVQIAGAPPLGEGESPMATRGTDAGVGIGVAAAASPAAQAAPAPRVARGTPVPGAETTAAATPARALSRAADKGGPSSTSIYVILIIGAVIAFGGGQLFRRLGVRMA